MRTLPIAALVSAATAVALAVAPLPAHAAEPEDYRLDTAADLATLCAQPGNAAAIHMCHGFLAGVHQMHVALATATGAPLYCVPADANVTREVAEAAFVAWARERDDLASMSARDGLIAWARDAFPCA